MSITDKGPLGVYKGKYWEIIGGYPHDYVYIWNFITDSDFYVRGEGYNLNPWNLFIRHREMVERYNLEITGL